MNSNLLITGGLGYLGGRLAAYLSSKNTLVRLTNRPNGRTVPKWADAYEIIPVDFGSDTLPRELCMGIDTVVHLAALNAQQSAEDPFKAIQTNIVGTLRLLNASIAAGVKRFIYLSTAHVYGSPLEGYIDENTITRPKHPYAWSRRATEDVIGGITGIETVVLRMTNAVGAPEDPNVNCWMLIANGLCREAIAHGSITLRSSGEEFRDFISINDFCRAIDHILFLRISASEPQLFNLGGRCTMPVLALAKRISDRVENCGRPRPELKIGSLQGRHRTFDYRVDHLLKTGFRLKGDLDNQIDETLAFCTTAFDSC